MTNFVSTRKRSKQGVWTGTELNSQRIVGIKVSESCFKMALSSKVRQLLMGMGAYAQTTKGFDRVAKAVSRKKMKGNTPSGAKPNYSN